MEDQMALNKITYFSETLHMRMSVNVIIPENKWGYSLADRPEEYRYPTLWLLCGGGFDYSDWERYTAIELYAAQAGIAVVMPSVFYSGYMDTVHGDYKYWTQITKELPPFLRGILPLSDQREDNFVAGFSMGGYGAFKWAMQNPDMFTACGVFSGPIGIITKEKPVYGPGHENDIGFRETEDEKGPFCFHTMVAAFSCMSAMRYTDNDNLYMLEKHLKNKTDLPKFYVATGQEDHGAKSSYKTADKMHEMGLEFEDVRDHGKHNWEYCNREVGKFIDWIPLKNVFRMEEE
jgi:putative tributyrin esterase